MGKRHFDDFRAGVIRQFFKRGEGLTSADNIIHDQHALALHLRHIIFANEDLLALECSDRIHVRTQGLTHVNLLGFQSDDIVVLPGLTRHLIYERDAFGCRCQHDVKFRRTRQQFLRGVHRDPYVPVENECCNLQIIRHLEQFETFLHSRNIYFVIHHLPPYAKA